MICEIKQIPISDPKFHKYDKFDGAGRSIKELLIIFNRGWVLRRVWAIGFYS